MKEELGAWHPVLERFLLSEEGIRLGTRLGQDEKRLQPKLPQVFRALKLTQPADVKVVILGQDPYPNGHADGLAFSSGIAELPFSLKVIYRELEKMNFIRTRLTLDDWAEQGVLLLNTSLTTLYGLTEAHTAIGWRGFIETVLTHIAEYLTVYQPVVFMAWGTPAKQRMKALNMARAWHSLLLEANHPASEKHGYIFNAALHFQKANEFLEQRGVKPIKWSD